MSQADTVVFRRWRATGDVIALFPELPADLGGDHCDSYEHVGQHGGADYHSVVQHTTPCSPDDAADLAAELRTVGYVLRPIKRANRRHHDNRRQTASDLRNTV
jgi:hypothetical protein